MSNHPHSKSAGAAQSAAKQNSYTDEASEDPQGAPDIQQSGAAGDLGNGPETGKRGSEGATTNSAAPQVVSDAGGRSSSSPRHTPHTEGTPPEDAAEPSNSYSGT